MHTARTIFAALVLASTVATGCDLDSDRIGEEGGVVVSADGRMALEIPEGALDKAVEITIEVVDSPEGAMAPLYVIEPMGLTFQKPTALIYDYDDDTLAGNDPDALTMVAHRELDWAYLADKKVDAEDQTVTASLMAVSAVTVVVEG
jgi:hypothetical protein